MPEDPRPDLPAESAYFLQVNRNKKRYGLELLVLGNFVDECGYSVTVNLKSPKGIEIVHELVKTADVFVEN